MTYLPLGRFAAALTGLAALAPISQGQTTLIEEGDPVPGLPGLVCTRIDDVAVNNQGDWVLRIDTDADSAMDEVILKNGALQFQQGTSTNITEPAGATFFFLDSAILSNAGDEIYSCTIMLAGGSNAQVVYRNGGLLIEQNITVITAPTLPVGSIWESISEVWANSSNQLLVGGRTDGGKNCIIQINLDAAGAVASEEVIVIEGETLLGHPTPVQGLSLNRHRNDINDAGETLWFVDDEDMVAGGSDTNDNWIQLNSAPLFREGDPMTVPNGRDFGLLVTAEIKLNNVGDYVYQGRTGDTSSLDVIVVNDSTLVAAEGDPVPDIAGSWTLTTIGSASGAFLADTGAVLWYGVWDDTNSDIDSGLFLDQTSLIQEGVSLINGNVIDTISSGDKGFALSDSGKYLIAELFSTTTQDPTLNGAYLYDLDPPIGDAYCAVALNSTGSASELSAIGSTEVASNDLTLTSSSLPLSAFGYVIASTTQGFAMNAGGSTGNLCISGDIGRLVGGVIGNAGTTGSFSVTADLNAMPQSQGPVVVVAGETWNFQTWHRDSDSGAPTSNFTNGLEITFN